MCSRIVIVFVAALLPLVIWSAEIRGKVVAITDGDTVKVLDDLDGGLFRVRLAGVDAPEKGQDFGMAAKKHLSTMAFGKAAVVRYKSIDRFGRIIGKLTVAGKDIAGQMLLDGMSWHYSAFDNSQEYAEAQREAQENKRGIWKNGKAIPPWEWREKLHKKSRSE